MASGAKNFAWISGQSLDLDYYAYLSHFHEGICKAIEENKVDETHLLALHFAIMANWWSSDWDLYLNIFVAVMEHLIYARSPSGCKQTSSYIWRYLLSFHRRISRRLTANRLYSMHLLQNQLLSDLMQCEITQRILG